MKLDLIFYNYVQQLPCEDLKSTNWAYIKDPIVRLEYQFYNKKIIFSNYQSYNYLLDAPAHKLYLFAKKDQDVLVICLDHFYQKLTYMLKKFGYEHNRRAIQGWKDGIVVGEPNCDVEEFK